MSRLGFAAPGFDPGGGAADAPAPPAPPVPADPADPDIGLVAFIAARVGITPSPVVVAPGPAAPSITWRLISEVPTVRLSGAAGSAVRTYQVDFRATTPDAPFRLAERLRMAVQGFRGAMGQTIVQCASYRRIPSEVVPAANGGASGTFRYAAEVAIRYVQPFPQP